MENKGFVEAAACKDTKFEERERKIVIDGVMNFSFGKNGMGLTDELKQIGELVNTLSKDNHIYIEDAFIDTADDVYDIKFRIFPREENKWMMDKNAFGNFDGC